MRYIKTFEKLLSSNFIRDYDINPKNFPDNETIKDVFEDLKDWCDLNNLRFEMFNTLCISAEHFKYYQSAFALVSPKKYISIKSNNNIKSDTLIYKAYRINIVMENFIDIPNKDKIIQKIHLGFERLKKIGFNTNYISERGIIIIYVVDPEPVKNELFEKIRYVDVSGKNLPDCSHNDIVNEYIKDLSNFPELDNIKSILRDFSDWCYINNIKPIEYVPFIFRFDKQLENRISILHDLTFKEDSLIKNNNIYYKTYVLFIFKPTVQADSYNKEIAKEIYKDFKEQIDLVIKRLTNYGFFVKNYYTNPYAMMSLYVIDKGYSITFQEIINKK